VFKGGGVIAREAACGLGVNTAGIVELNCMAEKYVGSWKGILGVGVPDDRVLCEDGPK